MESVDLTHGRIELSLSGTVGDWFGTSWGWNDIFGIESVDGWKYALFNATWEDGNSTDWLAYNETWKWNGYIVAFSDTGMSVTPEPATLAMIGLGLAGLGYARRRQQLRKATAT
jgi:hypothetical protein